MRIGVISDTHGLLRPEAVAALAGSDLIIHAGDVGAPGIIETLARIAPVQAVRGNVDHGAWADKLPLTQDVSVGERRLHVLHILAELAVDARETGIAAVIFGHSHKPSIDWKDGVLHLNPGSAGPRRFRLPITLARIEVAGRDLRPQIVALE